MKLLRAGALAIRCVPGNYGGMHAKSNWGSRSGHTQGGAGKSLRPELVPPDAQSPWVLLRSASSHPFIYKRMVRDVDGSAKPGDVVSVYDKSGRFFGRGLYNPRSQIVVRLLTHADVPIDNGFWHTRLEEAVALRRRLGLAEVSDAYRLVHAEGDGLSGLIVERYADHLVFEIFARGMFQRYAELAGILAAILGRPTSLDRPDKASATWRIVLRADARVEQLEGFRLPARSDLTGAEPPPRVTIREHGVRYWVDVKAGHKTGFFCDQRENRLRFAQLCRDASVLDLCCYTGAFGLSAKLCGGARDVISVDLDEVAVAVARENANLNQARIDYVHADAFPFIRQMLANGRQFDAVVLDPPKLATTRDDYDDALRKYYDFNQLAVQVVRRGGVFLTCSCSGLVSRPVFTETVQHAAQRAGRTLQLFAESGAAADHPIRLNCPESAYLKALWFRVL